MTAPAAGELVVEAEGLGKRYGDHVALRDVSLSLPAGSVLGLLGPNGAGKTTTVRILSTLLQPDSGWARVAGFDVVTSAHDVRHQIGFAGQYAALDGLLTGRENLMMIGRLMHLGRRASIRRADDLLTRFDLGKAADRPVQTYSGGMRRRLDLAACLTARPTVLFLDEPTTGLDPVSRASLWDLVKETVAEGAGVLLTTQYLEEADQLADQVVLVDRGTVIAQGSPESLKRMVRASRLQITVANEGALWRAQLAAFRIFGVEPEIDATTNTLWVPLQDGLNQIAAVAAEMQREDVDIVDLSVHRPTLDEVFFELTGANQKQANPVKRRWRAEAKAARKGQARGRRH